MRHFILSLIVLLLFICAPAYAEIAPVTFQENDRACVLNGSTSKPCPVITDNNKLRDLYNGLRLERNVNKSNTPLYLYDQCQFIDAEDGLTNDIFIPIKTDVEWNAFLTNLPPLVRVSKCCPGKTLSVSDATKPTQICATGE